MTKLSLAHALAIALAATALSGPMAMPAAAQVGGIVHDPRNYAQNILTAARTLEQINNQISMLQNQATSLINEAKNLTGLPVSTLETLQSQVDQTRQHEMAARIDGFIASAGLRRLAGIARVGDQAVLDHQRLRGLRFGAGAVEQMPAADMLSHE